MSIVNNKQKLISILPLLTISLICVASITTTHYLTKNDILENKERTALAVINDVLPIEYDNDLLSDKTDIEVPKNLNPNGIITAYRARQNENPIAVSLMPIITKGYSSNISLVIGIDYNGSITGIRVLQQNETEGFGNEVHQDNSDWIFGFNKFNIQETKEKNWAIKKDGGEFDQLSGATITSRSVINIIYKTLEYYLEHRDSFYENQ